MLSSHRVIRGFALLSLFLVFVHAHDVPLVQRDHAAIQRMMKKRSPQGLPPVFGNPQAGAAADTTSTDTSSSTTSSSTSSTSTTSSSTPVTTGTDATSSTTSTTSGTLISTSTNSTSTSTTSSTSSTPTTTQAITTDPPAVANTHTVIGSAVTKTASVNATPSAQADAQSNTSSSSGSTTMTIIIAIAASIGGVAILWTIFRKWKLSSSKKFDERLNPDWRPPSATPDDSPIPIHRRRGSGSSFNSGSGHGQNNLDHDFTATTTTHSTPVGGYADLSRGANPPMQESHLHRGPSVNRGYDIGVPLHHQTGAYQGNNNGPYEAFDYNGQGVRY